ncbi:MAG: rubredoxin [Clostridia bacterium]|nr:rubredoxin [Clostridia bacterium]
MLYVCALCGYEYNPETGDPENDIDPGTDFEDLPEDWECPLCGAGKDDFEAVRTADDEDDDLL